MLSKIVVVMPAWNEESEVGTVVSQVLKTLKNACVVVVDDGSTDRTSEVASNAGAIVVRFAGHRGLTAAFVAGLRKAVALDADVIVNMDADGQHDPADLPKLVKPVVDNEADYVIGSRFTGRIEYMSMRKKLGNKIVTWLVSVISGTKVTDAQSGFRAFSREVAEQLRILDGYTYTQQAIIQAARNNFRIVEVPIDVKARRSGSSRLIKNIFSYAYQVSNLLFFTLAFCFPLQLFGILGLLMVLAGGVIAYGFQHNFLSIVVISTGIQFALFGVLFAVLRKSFFK